MACHLAGAKPLSEPMMVSLLTHICVTQPQWVNSTSLVKKRLKGSLSLTNFLCKSDLAEILFHFIQNYGAEYGFHMYCMSRQWSCYKITRIKNYSKVVFASGLSFEWKIVSEMCICVGWIDLCHKSHNAPVSYPTMHHFGTEMYISVPKWWIVGYGTGALWNLRLVYCCAACMKMASVILVRGVINQDQELIIAKLCLHQVWVLSEKLSVKCVSVLYE